MTLRLLVLSLWCTGAAHAGSVSLFVSGKSTVQQRAHLEQITRRALKETSLSLKKVGEGDSSCQANACWFRFLKTSQSSHVLVVELLSDTVRGQWFDFERHRAGPRLQSATSSGLEPALTALLRAVTPPHVYQGLAMVEFDGAPVWGLRIDGESVALPDVPKKVVPAGARTIDVELKDGQSLLFPLHLQEGQSHTLHIEPWASAGRSSAKGRALRAVSYGLWTTGAVALAGSLVAATLSREASARLTPCQSTDRACLTLAEAQSIQHLAEVRAQNANLLLISGAALATAGAGLFFWQWVFP